MGLDYIGWGVWGDRELESSSNMLQLPLSFSTYLDKNEFFEDEDIILKWTPSENATSYGVYVAKEPYGPRNLIYDLEGITGNSLNIGILPAGKYCFNMQAMNDAGASPFSNVTYFTVVKAPQEQKKTLNLKINDVYKRNSIVYVPIRYVAESLGSNVSWDNNTQSIVIQKGLDAIVFQIGSKKT